MKQGEARELARQSALQAIYQWQVTGENLSEIERQFAEEHGLGNANREYFSAILHGLPAQIDVIDTALAEFVDRPVNEIDMIEKALLRVGTYELLFRLEVPYRYIINECINLTKEFGNFQSHKYINGILDKVARKHRAVEVAAFSKKRR